MKYIKELPTIKGILCWVAGQKKKICILHQLLQSDCAILQAVKSRGPMTTIESKQIYHYCFLIVVCNIIML